MLLVQTKEIGCNRPLKIKGSLHLYTESSNLMLMVKQQRDRCRFFEGI